VRPGHVGVVHDWMMLREAVQAQLGKCLVGTGGSHFQQPTTSDTQEAWEGGPEERAAPSGCPRSLQDLQGLLSGTLVRSCGQEAEFHIVTVNSTRPGYVYENYYTLPDLYRTPGFKKNPFLASSGWDSTLRIHPYHKHTFLPSQHQLTPTLTSNPTEFEQRCSESRTCHQLSDGEQLAFIGSLHL